MLSKTRWRHRLRRHSIRNRMKTVSGRRIIAARRKKGRKNLAILPKKTPLQ